MINITKIKQITAVNSLDKILKRIGVIFRIDTQLK